eukprot:COSAG02_NODE_1265_length_13542_cov_5.803615_2_plen_64_part_00
MVKSTGEKDANEALSYITYIYGFTTIRTSSTGTKVSIENFGTGEHSRRCLDSGTRAVAVRAAM